MIRWLAVTAVLLGLIAGLAFPIGSKAVPTGQLYKVWITPPTGVEFQQVQLNCGWHTGACDSPTGDGPALDWNETSTTALVYFRGGFMRTGLSGPTNKLLTLNTYTINPGPDGCDEVAADLWENLVGPLASACTIFT